MKYERISKDYELPSTITEDLLLAIQDYTEGREGA